MFPEYFFVNGDVIYQTKKNDWIPTINILV